jgi:hypothetical protein
VKYREVAMAADKLPGRRRSGHELNVWAEIDGRRVLRLTVPKVHGGDVPAGTVASMSKQLRLSAEQFRDLAQCRMTGAEYERHIRTRLEEDG